MEGAVARWYARLTKKSMEEFRILARRVAAQVPSGARVLEVAPGPGYFAIELAKQGNYDVTGLDISRTFVEIAQNNATEARVKVKFLHGNVADMPLADQSFDFVLCRAAFKNFSEPVRALQEMYRVLKPGGKALIIDLRRDASMDSIRTAVKDMHFNAVDRFITTMTFRHMLLRRAYTRRGFEEMISRTRFQNASVDENPIGLEILLSKPGDDFISWAYFTLYGASWQTSGTSHEMSSATTFIH